MGISGMEGLLLAASAICFAVSFLIPEKKREGSGLDKELAKEEIKDLVREEVDGIRSRVDDVVSDSMNVAMEKTERSLERISNEKIMAVNEYSDTVMKEIHNSHEEVIFLYDMLNSKHDSLKKTVTEASKAAKAMQSSVESLQSFRPVEVSYGEGSVKIAPMASKRKEDKDEELRAKEQEELRAFKPNVKPYPMLGRSIVQDSAAENTFAESIAAGTAAAENVIPGSASVGTAAAVSVSEGQESGSGSQKGASDAAGVLKASNDLEFLQASDEGTPGEGVSAENGAQIRVEGENGRNSNESILELHKQGKSNVAIAKELGLGVGEVKLVIDLYKNA